MVVAVDSIVHRAAGYQPDDLECLGAGVRCGRGRTGSGTAIRPGHATEARVEGSTGAGR